MNEVNDILYETVNWTYEVHKDPNKPDNSYKIQRSDLITRLPKYKQQEV